MPIVLALIATLFGLCGPVMAAAAPPPSIAQDTQSTGGLVALLEQRAQDVVTQMGAQETRAIASIRRGYGFDTAPQFLKGWNARRNLFQSLHRDNIAALKRHDLARSHAITIEIDALLHEQEAFLFTASQASRRLHYEVFFDEPARLAQTTYPGAIPASLSKSAAQQAAQIAQPPAPGGYDERAKKLKALIEEP